MRVSRQKRGNPGEEAGSKEREPGPFRPPRGKRGDSGSPGGGRVFRTERVPAERKNPEGLREDEAAIRWAEVGPSVVAASKHQGWPWRLLTATRNPLVILLTVLAAISFATGDVRAGAVMPLMVFLGMLLRKERLRLSSHAAAFMNWTGRFFRWSQIVPSS